MEIMEQPGLLRRIYRVLADAIGHFANDDGFAVASHVALSGLLALFPFLIFVAALSGFLGLQDVAQQASELIFDAWPKEVAGPVSGEIQSVLTQPRGDLLTFGVIVTIWFSSNGVEALRTALNRAYRVKESRNWFYCRLQSIVVVLLGSLVLVVFTALIILGPLIWNTVVDHVPVLQEFGYHASIIRYGVTSILLVVALFGAHVVLPAGERTVTDVLPGVVITLVLWIASGSAFGAYLARFANYVSTYAGLAGVMTALIFLYLTAAIFILGGEFNAAIMRQRKIRNWKQSALAE
ncbi:MULTISPECIES: YihY/virulence factor BrkB family protein [Pseudovibrio]|uniref:YihY/virulence factor BrkB family protein n=1 Tax=Stappiaceae TaxID=2821832 RepID=UPI0029C53BDA|nr:YihY/virulence factor BrkB family protein [Pseudovibrio sp. SPO723]MDX5594876.1 YihY/virulence factor BrkB family protein [Pseudovibrio sp. SPO723]